MHQYLEFDSFDNPMHLSKVGNWVITFLSPKDELEHVQLAVTQVLPRQMNDQLQMRRVIIHNTDSDTLWQIEKVECFCGQTNKELEFNADDATVVPMLKQLLNDFAKYDVPVQLSTNPV